MQEATQELQGDCTMQMLNLLIEHAMAEISLECGQYFGYINRKQRFAALRTIGELYECLDVGDVETSFNIPQDC